MQSSPMEETLQQIGRQIAAMKAAMERLESVRQEYPALDRNLVRISANIKMLEINFVDPTQV